MCARPEPLKPEPLNPKPLAGDYEHVKVYVCEAAMAGADPSAAVARAQYSGHGGVTEFDCASGQCAWEADPVGQRRLVTLAGLGSHANWKEETPFLARAQVGRGCSASSDDPNDHDHDGEEEEHIRVRQALSQG